MGIIVVGASSGVKSRVRIVMHLADVVDRNISTYKGVERTHQILWVCQWLLNVKMGNHASSIDAGVGATGSGNFYRVAQYDSQRVFNCALHTDCIWL